MKRILLILLMVLITFHGNAFAVGSVEVEATDEERKPTSCIFLSMGQMVELCFDLFGGYRFVDLNGSAEVEEYEYLHNSILLGGELRLYSTNSRIHFDADYTNSKDYGLDLSYSYKDILLFRGVNSTLYHNLNNIRLIDLDPSTPSPGVDVMDDGKDYGVKTGMSNLFLRLKSPNFPFHAYIKGGIVEKKGTQQQRFMSGAAYFNDIVRASRSRDTDWRTENIVIGANSHLGPVEIDYSHGEKRFDAGGDNVLYDSYSYSGFGPGFRQPGVYPHNQVSDLKGSSDTFKIHTSYTGRIVASATLSRIDRENTDSNATADYFIGSGEVTWMPVEKWTAFLKYRYRDRDVDNPDKVTITDISNPLNSYIYDVKPSISSISKTLSGTVRYRPSNRLTLKAKYSNDDIRRKDADEWDIPDRTTTNSASVSADMRIKRNLKLKAGYTHKSINNPSTNVEPDSTDEGNVSASWIPLTWINTLLSYNIKDENRNELHFADTEEAGNRDVKKHRMLGSVTFLVLKDTSITTSYAYIDNTTKQDIVYHDNPGNPNIDPYVPYDATAHNFAIDIMYVPHNRVSINAGLNHTRSKANFHPDDINLTQPVSISSFSELKTEETVYSVSGEYRFRNSFLSGLEYRYSDLDDLLDKPDDDVEDGRAHVLLLTLSKEW